MLNESAITAKDVTWNDERPHRRSLWLQLSCALFGHRVSNVAFATIRGPEKHCACGKTYLGRGEETRVTHTVSCFVFGHNYIQIAERAGHHEYVCSRCGHPLLFAIEHDPYARQGAFRKKVRYRCNLFGHHVHHVTERHGFTEYACHCGHSFLKEDAGKEVVKHPLVCLFSGHYVSFTESRGGYDEYRCRNCGHTFYFVVSR